MPGTRSFAIDVGAFDIPSMLRCGRALRDAGRSADSIEAAAQEIVRLLYDGCVDPATGDRSCALVRFYKTHDIAELDEDLQAYVARQLGRPAAPGTKALVLLGTTGDDPDWPDRHRSQGHRAIPLASADVVREAPMIARLLEQFGVAPQELFSEATDVLPDREGRTYNVFHVENALGSPYIPAQRDFVVRHGIRSVVGFGGLLRSGHLWATILFSRATIPPESAARFRPLAVEVKAGLFFRDERQTFTR